MSNLERRVQRTRAGIKDQKDTAEQNWDAANPDIDEASDRCGIDSRNSLTGVVLVETATGIVSVSPRPGRRGNGHRAGW